MIARNSVPTLTIGGFLGAGKTTLVNHLLKGADGARVVVFVNDFGAINIDCDLIETVETDRIALSNGCVCCTLNDDLIHTMAEMCETDPPDMFVIEASGVADPKSLAATLNALKHSGHAHLQARVYVLDAACFGGLDYADTEDLVDHAAASDLIVINKSDLVAAQRLEEIETLLGRSAPRSVRKVTAHGQISLSDLQGGAAVGKYASDKTTTSHDVDARFSTFSFQDIPPLSQERLERLSGLLKDTCLRAKGVLLADAPRPPAVLLQLVGRQLDVRPVEAKEDAAGRLVTIGWSQQLNPAALSALLCVPPVAS